MCCHNFNNTLIMSYNKMKKKWPYKVIALPESMANDIDDFIKSNPEKGYKSRSDLTKDALRRFFDQQKKAEA